VVEGETVVRKAEVMETDFEQDELDFSTTTSRFRFESPQAILTCSNERYETRHHTVVETNALRPIFQANIAFDPARTNVFRELPLVYFPNRGAMAGKVDLVEGLVVVVVTTEVG
jgi:hypothetical protein